eukprot:scaffold405_cov243-Pinguiococcus_pyrenoidosus.AAC.8
MGCRNSKSDASEPNPVNAPADEGVTDIEAVFENLKDEPGPAKLQAFHLETRLGDGAYSVVWLGTHIESGFKFAIKEMPEDKVDSMEATADRERGGGGDGALRSARAKRACEECGPTEIQGLCFGSEFRGAARGQVETANAPRGCQAVRIVRRGRGSTLARAVLGREAELERAPLGGGGFREKDSVAPAPCGAAETLA